MQFSQHTMPCVIAIYYFMEFYQSSAGLADKGWGEMIFSFPIGFYFTFPLYPCTS